MSDINWPKITFDDFERFTFCLVEAMGFDDPKRTSGTGDLGEDIVAFQPANLPGIGLRSRKWVFQCKRVKTLRKLDITEELANFASRKIDTWMLVTNYNPSPAFQRWFDSLGQSQKYPFHIQAWWRNDLEHFIRIHASYLEKCLPERIVDCLSLTQNSEGSDGSYEAVLARLRLLADSQIERFAKGKYIPRLYVRRQLQDELSRFLIPDTQIAGLAKSSAVNMIETASLQIENYPATFDLKTADVEREIASLKKRRIKAKDRTEINVLLSEKQNKLKRRLEIKNSAGELIVELLRRLQSLLTATNRLPGSYFRHVGVFTSHLESMASFVSFLDARLKSSPAIGTADVPDDSGGKTSLGSMREPAIEMLSDGGFIFSLRERLARELSNLESSLRNALVIVDRAGGGKTNLICHLVQSVYTTQPVILFFGKEHFDQTKGLEKATTEIIAKCYGHFSNDLLQEFDLLLEKEDQHLTVVIDGINENRHLADLDVSLESFLEWAHGHRIRIIITCRDIYWEFFNFENWSHNVQKIIRERLNQFAPTEYGFALPLYLDYYNIKCSLAKEAKEACHHPLLLRFFCEAYGSIEGEPISLGDVWDIRLKELFDVYLQRKTEQIRKSMEHRNTDLVFRYLFNLVAFLFKHLTTVISTLELEEATGDADTSTQQSLYLHLLDEDIIIEEQPADELQTRRVGFVYEEFMEYLLASSILSLPKRYEAKSVSDIFAMLKISLGKWVNARGVGEYVALMLLGDEHGYSRQDAIAFLRKMARGGKTWSEAFWSVVGKCSESQLGPDLFDEFYFAIDALSHPKTIVKALTAMSRYDKASCSELASIILWSSALPKTISWTELSLLPLMSRAELKQLSSELCSKLETRNFSAAPGKSLSYETLFESITPFLDSDVKKRIDEGVRKYGLPVRLGDRAFLFAFWKHSPEHGPFLLNGLFSSDHGLRSFCADRLRFAKRCPEQLSFLCQELARFESDPDIRRLLRDAADLLQKQLVTRRRNSTSDR